MRRRLLLFAATVLAAATPVAAQHSELRRLDGSSIKPFEVDGAVTRLMEAAEVTGLGLAVFDQGKIAYLKAYGVRDKEAGSPLTVDSVMSGASFSKVAFAYMVMQLVDKGTLNLDEPVYLYLPKPLPDYPNYKDLANDLRYKQITARMLLSHTTGFPNWRWFEEDAKLRIHFEPGSRYAYSGEGIVLLQLVVEAITKEPLEALMQERVFRPLGMTRTSMIWQERFESDYAKGYDVYGRSLGPQKRVQADAAGSMLTTTSDFARFVQAVMLGKGLGKKARSEMLSPQIQIVSKHQFPTLASETTDENKAIRLSYGLGWGLYWTPYGKTFFKEGHDEGWRNYTACFDEKKMGIVLMTNSGNGEGIYKELLESVLKNTFTPIEWEGFTPYDRLPPRTVHKEVQVDPKLFDGYVGHYEPAPNVVVTITREGDHLFGQATGEPKAELFPESERDFFFKVVDIQVTFEVDAQGRATGLIVHQGGANIPCKRLD
jgi:CubicO group peptidase (beta-lactamase class C family)